MGKGKMVKEIRLKPVGLVRNKVKKPRFGNYASEVSEIVLDKKFAAALEGVKKPGQA